MKRFRRAAFIAALVLTVAAGAAWATGAIDAFVAADGTITACIQKDSYGVRIVPAGTACRSTEQAVTFNQRGVQGPQGVQGIQGPKGDKGDPGVQGIQGIQGVQGDAGVSLTAAPLAAGSAHCDGNGGVEITPADEPASVLGYVCNGAPGPQGPKGDPGTNGTNGTNGGDLVGSPCALPDGTAGTVQMTVAADGTIAWTCHTTAPPSVCPSPLPSYPNAVTNCDQATGVVSLTCNTGFDDRDGLLGDGCEYPFNPQPEVCNGIDDNLDGQVDNGAPVPAIPNGIGACSGGTFVVASCNAGFADADGVFANGCEVNLMVDANNCGSVGNRVPPAGSLNANWACVSGTVVITSCLAGWADMDHSPLDGCESPLDPDPSGNTQATAIFLGNQDCNDGSLGNLGGAIANVNDNDWYAVNATGGLFCQNDFGSSYGAAAGVAYDLITNVAVVPNITGGYSAGSGFYSDGTTIFIHVHSLGGSGAYSLQFHL